MKLTFIESRGFTEKLATLVADHAYREFQNELQEYPQKGDLIQGTAKSACVYLDAAKVAAPV